MKDIKTRPKTREVKVRDAGALAPRELAKVLRDAGKAKLERQGRTAEDGGTTDSAAVRDAVGEFEGDVQGVTAYGSRTAFKTGKALAQKRYDAQFRPSRSGAKTQAGGASTQDAPPATSFPEHTPEPPRTAKAKQEYRRKKASQQQQTQREHRQFSTRAESCQRSFDLQRGADATDSAVSVPRREGGASRQRPQASPLQRGFTGPRGKSAPTGVQAGRPVPRNKPEPGVTGRLKQSYATRAKAHATRKMQAQMARETAQKTTQTAKATAKGVSRLKDAVVRAGKAIVRAAVGLLGGACGLIALVLVIGGAAAVIATPFGVFWSGQDADAQSIPMAVTQINSEFAAKISQIQIDNPADSEVVIHRVPSGGSDLAITNWTDIVAVFAAKVAGADADATDVVTIDAERIDLLRTVFWDMNAVSYRVEVIPGGEDESDTTVLHITIASKTATEMPDIYGFSASQRQALTEMLKPEYAQMLAELVGTYGGEVELTPEQLAAMLENLPEDLPADRRAVVEQAYSLLGRVNYFWGGKSSAIGWDSRWGTPMKVTAAGSRTTGTIRPYGMDCAGFVDWVFNNALGCVIGHGGGAHAQHTYCTPIAWNNAIPGDLVFYPGDSHVGVYVGTDENGPLIVHCASSQNNVVLTGLQGFTSIGRPNIYS